MYPKCFRGPGSALNPGGAHSAAPSPLAQFGWSLRSTEGKGTGREGERGERGRESRGMEGRGREEGGERGGERQARGGGVVVLGGD